MADDGCREEILPLGHGADAVGEDGEARHRRERLGAAVPGQLGDEDAVAARQQRSHVDPVRGRTAEPVHEDERTSFALAADEVPQPAALDVGEALVEAGYHFASVTSPHYSPE